MFVNQNNEILTLKKLLEEVEAWEEKCNKANKNAREWANKLVTPF